MLARRYADRSVLVVEDAFWRNSMNTKCERVAERSLFREVPIGVVNVAESTWHDNTSRQATSNFHQASAKEQACSTCVSFRVFTVLAVVEAGRCGKTG